MSSKASMNFFPRPSLFNNAKMGNNLAPDIEYFHEMTNQVPKHRIPALRDIPIPITCPFGDSFRTFLNRLPFSLVRRAVENLPHQRRRWPLSLSPRAACVEPVANPPNSHPHPHA